MSQSDVEAVQQGPEDFLSSRYYQQIATLVGCYAGIQLPLTKKHMVEGRLRKRARACGFESLDDYCRHLLAGSGFDAEFAHFIDILTTNKTDFFREPSHFPCLQRVVSALLEKNCGQGRVIKIWSAACSNGAEPYTIAMVLADMAASQRFRFSILATDICTKVLEEGRRAVYSREMIDQVPEAYGRRYVMRSRSARQDARIVPELRRLVRFERLNLMDDNYPVDNDVDVIFLRNVLIYFERAGQQRVITHLVRHLRPGGHLFLGHSESMVAAGLNLQQVCPAVFQKL